MEENVLLDDLVLQNIVAMERNCFENIAREQISQRLAMNLRAHYDATKFGLIIRTPTVDRSENGNFLVELGSFKSRYGTLAKLIEWSVNREKIQSALTLIFSRIKRFHIMRIRTKFCPLVSGVIAKIFEQDEYGGHLLEMDQLQLVDEESTNDYCSNCLFVPGVPCEQCHRERGPFTAIVRLIKTQSSLLKQLDLQLCIPQNGTANEQFWSTISSCTKLQKLSIGKSIISPQRDTLDECIKVLNISSLKLEEWSSYDNLFEQSRLTNALSNNGYLRKISLAVEQFRHKNFATSDCLRNWNGVRFPSIRPILARLNCFKLHFSRGQCFPFDYDRLLPDIVGILRSMSENGHISANHCITW
jgi:hypothetical protein